MPPPRSILHDYLEASVVALVVFLWLSTWVFQQSKIPSGSMEPTVVPGDRVLVNKFVFAPGWPGAGLLPARDPRRGDIVVFKFPRSPDQDFIKRIIGLPGETIEILGREVRVNGEKIEEPYARFRLPPGHARVPGLVQRLGPFRIPEGEYFVMGDNRDESNDSRFWGTVPRQMIRGRAVCVIFSWAPAPRARRFRPEGGAPPGKAWRLRADRFLLPIR